MHTTENLEAIKHSDKSAFKELYVAYYEPLYRFAWRHVRDSELALDLVQETFTRVWTRRNELQTDKPVKSYLYRIIHNLAIDHARKQTVREEALNVLPFNDTHEDNHDAQENVQTIENAIEGLPEGQREVFQMNRYEGLKYAEIAEILDISVKAVEKRMSKALGTLRAQLKHLLTTIVIIFSNFMYFW